jgi:hypothetical protein
MSELTRRDTSRSEETWLVYLEDVHIGTIGLRAGAPSDAEQWAGAAASFPDRGVGPAPRARLRRRDLYLKPKAAAKLHRR